MSGRLVAAIITIPSVGSKPSISASIWLRVCSRSSCPPPSPAPRLRPMESISSMKMIALPILRAESKRSRTRLAPTPTNISMKSEPVTERNGTPCLACHRFGYEGLAGARRADQHHSLGDAGADLGEWSGVLQELDDLGDLLFDAFVTRHVVEGGPGALGRVGLGLASADRHDVPQLPLGSALHPEEEPDEQQHREQDREDRSEEVRLGRLEFELGVLADQVVVGVGQAVWGPVVSNSPSAVAKTIPPSLLS